MVALADQGGPFIFYFSEGPKSLAAPLCGVRQLVRARTRVRPCVLHRSAPADGRRKEEVETRAAAPRRSSSQSLSQPVEVSQSVSPGKKSLRSCGRLVSPPSLLCSRCISRWLFSPRLVCIFMLNVDVWGGCFSSSPSRLQLRRNKPRFSRRPCTYLPSFLPSFLSVCRFTCDRLVLHLFKHRSCRRVFTVIINEMLVVLFERLFFYSSLFLSRSE